MGKAAHTSKINQHKRYKDENRRAKNKQRRMERTARKQPNNEQVRMAVDMRKEFDRQNATVNAEQRAANKARWADGFGVVLTKHKSFQDAVQHLPSNMLDIRHLYHSHMKKGA
jgi:hypothetical protein